MTEAMRSGVFKEDIFKEDREVEYEGFSSGGFSAAIVCPYSGTDGGMYVYGMRPEESGPGVFRVDGIW